MTYKDGVYTEVVKVVDGKEVHLKPSPQIHAAMLAANALHKKMTGMESTITAIFDGEHMEGSKHYIGDAFDLRSWHLKGQKLTEFVKSLKVSIGTDFDIVIHKTHIHIEYDPKS